MGKELDALNLIQQDEIGNTSPFYNTFKLYLQAFQAQAKTETTENVN